MTFQEDLENDTICSFCHGHADIVEYHGRGKVCFKCCEEKGL